MSARPRPPVKRKPLVPLEDFGDPVTVETRNDRNTGDLLALDPSIGSSGVALFRGGILVAAARVRVPVAHHDMGARCLRMTQEILSWVIGCHGEPRTLVGEWPQVYRASKSVGDPNDLVGLSGVLMGVAGMLSYAICSRDLTLEVVTPLPAQWIGQLPKYKTVAAAKASPRASLILGSLNPEESMLVPASHDAIDAVGLGLYGLGRLKQTHVYAGAI